MGEDVIHAENLTKFYGKQRGIIDLSLEVSRGEVFGYLGPNGAGKTTTIRTLMDFIRPTRGRASIFGLDTRRRSREIRRHIGYLPGEMALYENMTGGDLLRYLGNLRGGVDWAVVEGLAERLDLNLNQRIRSLSHGNKQKVGLVQAFMNRPQLLVLDEPTTGLDPLMQQQFYQIVAEARANGQTVLLSSHVLPEVERVCDRVAIIREGRLVAVETVASLKARPLRRLEIHFASTVPLDAFKDLPGVSDVSVDSTVLRCTIVGKLDAVVKAAARYEVVTMVTHEPTLEEVFLTYYGVCVSRAA